MAFFAILERYDESAELFAHTFCFNRALIGYLPTAEKKMHEGRKESQQLLVTGASDASEQRVIFDRVAELNRLDVALYTHALSVFDERVIQMRRDQENGIICRHYLGDLENCAIKCDAAESFIAAHPPPPKLLPKRGKPPRKQKSEL
jgi:hypothetical protein